MIAVWGPRAVCRTFPGPDTTINLGNRIPTGLRVGLTPDGARRRRCHSGFVKRDRRVSVARGLIGSVNAVGASISTNAANSAASRRRALRGARAGPAGSGRLRLAAGPNLTSTHTGMAVNRFGCPDRFTAERPRSPSQFIRTQLTPRRRPGSDRSGASWGPSPCGCCCGAAGAGSVARPGTAAGAGRAC